MKQDYNDIYETCKDHMHAYVLLEMNDGSKLDGIITGVDAEHVYVAVPIGEEQFEQSNRQFGYGPQGYGYGQQGYGYGNQGYGYGHHGYGNPRPRFERVVLPLTFLAALSILPWY